MCESAVSQEDADLCAARQNVDCLVPLWPTDGTLRQTYRSHAQTCAVTCPDGNVFTYTVPAGLFEAFSQVTADAEAYSYACLLAGRNRICLAGLDTSACVGESYISTVAVTAENPLVSVVVVSGDLPPGLSLSFDTTSFTISGNPTTPSSYSFVISAEDSQGNVMQKSYTISVKEIEQDALPDGELEASYSTTLSPLGADQDDVQWALLSGALPTGLTLDTITGVISGTPTTTGTFTFTIGMGDA